MACNDCAEKLGKHADIFTAVMDEYARQAKGGKIGSSTVMLKSMMEAKIRTAGPKERGDIKAQLIEVMAAGLKLAEGL